jgi:hypothetical protein
MASLRRHLASLGLAVVLLHVVMQVLVPAALCCQVPSTRGAQAEAADCCPAGSHPGQVCPMHGKRAGQSKAAGDRDCAAQPLVDLHDILMTLSNGGVIPPLVALARPAGSEAAPAVEAPFTSPVASVPPGPPPRA